MNSEAALAKAVANQPVSVAICASPALQFYTGGALARAALAGPACRLGWLPYALRDCWRHPRQVRLVVSVARAGGRRVRRNLMHGAQPRRAGRGPGRGAPAADLLRGCRFTAQQMAQARVACRMRLARLTGSSRTPGEAPAL